MYLNNAIVNKSGTGRKACKMLMKAIDNEEPVSFDISTEGNSVLAGGVNEIFK